MLVPLLCHHDLLEELFYLANSHVALPAQNGDGCLQDGGIAREDEVLR